LCPLFDIVIYLIFRVSARKDLLVVSLTEIGSYVDYLTSKRPDFVFLLRMVSAIKLQASVNTLMGKAS
jgi:hypothetical protein